MAAVATTTATAPVPLVDTTPQDDPDLVNMAFRTFVMVNEPVVLLSAPGCGKTTHVRDLAAELHWPLYEIIPATREPADFGGYPLPEDGVIRLKPVGSWHDFAKKVEYSGNGILFLDECGACTLAQQNALLRVILDRIVGEFALPRGVRVVCAANPPDTSAGGWELSAAFANRMAHLNWPPPTVARWAAWLMRQPIPASIEPERALYTRRIVCSFLAARPELLLQLPIDDTARGGAWPSPRSWAACTRALTALMGDLLSDAEYRLELAELVVRATVGRGAAAALVDVLKGMDLVNPEELLAHPERWEALVVDAPCEPGKEMTRAWAALASVAATVLSVGLVHGKVTEARWKAAWEVHRHARLSKIAGGYVSGAAVAALAIPLATAALAPEDGLPTGQAYRLPFPPEAQEAVKLYTLAVGGGGRGEGEGRGKRNRGALA